MNRDLNQKYKPVKSDKPGMSDEEFKRRMNDTFDRYSQALKEESEWRKNYSKELGERLKDLESRKAAADDLLDKINKNKLGSSYNKPYTPSRGLPDPIRKPLTVNTPKSVTDVDDRIRFWERMRGRRDGSDYSFENRIRRNRAFAPTNISKSSNSVWDDNLPFNWNA